MNYISEVIYRPPDYQKNYPFNLSVLKNLSTLDLQSPVTFLVGENGSGKSTLVEAIAVAAGFNPEGGTKNFSFETYENSVSDLYNFLTLAYNRRPKDGFFLRAESFYNVASKIDELDKIPSPSARIIDSYGGLSLHKQSHGESFVSLLYNRFGGNGLYILDEPEAALSVSRQYEILYRIQMLVQQRSQFIIATHSPILLSFPGATIYEVSQSGLHQVAYEETTAYTFMKDFINNYQHYHKYLFEE